MLHRRLLCLLIMLILPIQFVWAGIDFDCQSSPVSACEIGAHALNGDGPIDKSAGTHSEGCIACHISYINAPVDGMGFDVQGKRSSPVSQPSTRLTSRISPPPERPQWA